MAKKFEITEADVQILREMRNWQKKFNAQAPGSVNTPYGASVGRSPGGGRRAPQQADSRVVRVQQTGGANGSQSSAATYTYSIRQLADISNTGTPIATAVAAANTRPNGAVTVGTFGLAFFDIGATPPVWKLLITGERPQTGNC
jgi:hypothetical protein